MSLVALGGGALYLKVCFNDLSVDAARVLLVVSPTCTDCLAGVRIVATAASDIRVRPVTILTLWTAMRPGDCEAAAARVSAAFGAELGFSHFWEEDGWPVSTVLRPLLGLGAYDPTRSAWDVYLFYEPGVRWVDQTPPSPTEWAHQLDELAPGFGERLSLATVRRWLQGPHNCR
jgi:hypothetical protein